MFQPIVYWGPATAPAWIDKNAWNWQNMTSKRHDQVASLRLRSMRSSRWQFRSIWRVMFFWLRMAKESTAREIGSLAYFFHRRDQMKLFEIVWATYIQYLHILNHFPHHYYWHLTDPHRAILPWPRLRVFFQLSQDLITIDQEVASLSREWGLQTTGTVTLV